MSQGIATQKSALTIIQTMNRSIAHGKEACRCAGTAIHTKANLRASPLGKKALV
jgi:hypothetical protein